MDIKEIIITCAIGAVSGWLASLIMNSSGGLIKNIIMGIIGSFVGNFVLGFFGITISIISPLVSTIIISAIGACIVIFIGRLVSK